MPMDGGAVTITVEARVMGQRRPLVEGWAVPLPARTIEDDGSGGAGALRLRDLLGHVVRQEVRAYRGRQEERRLARVLSPAQIAGAVARGKVEMGGLSEEAAAARAEVDEDAAVATALQAFEDGLYFVFLDGAQQENLDAAVRLKGDSTLTFIRLVALAGG